MDPNMTGEPNQDQSVHPSVFNFELYPPSQPINWNQTNPFANSLLAPSTSNTSFQQINVPQQSVNLPPFGGPHFPVQTNILASRLHAPNLSSIEEGFTFGCMPPDERVVQFPFEISQSSHGFGHKTIRCKRKTDSPPLQPPKQHITEEKMAEHMSKLHISSETASSKETESGRMQRLYMCEEMRKLQNDSIIPSSILTKIQQPCKALVLWNPPKRLVPPGMALADENENDNSDNASDSNVVANIVEADMDNEVLINNMEMDNC